jgi:hypothetical protein
MRKNGNARIATCIGRSDKNARMMIAHQNINGFKVHMRKEDNEWSLKKENSLHEDFRSQHCCVKINGTKYFMNEQFAGLAHCILLLVDAINDKDFRSK